MACAADGSLADDIALEDIASKSRSGRRIPVAKELKQGLAALREATSNLASEDHVVQTERGESTSAQVIINMFAGWYRAVGFAGCSSHSGRRTFITTAARRISTVGGSLRDVQLLAGHSALSTTQRYIEYSPIAARKVVDLV
jgi:integrase/recombinase XerD